MISNIESYKNSFTDVKLIYNMDEKNKRFNACEGTYKNLMEELEAIEVYKSTEVPGEFLKAGFQRPCMAIVIWSRRGA